MIIIILSECFSINRQIQYVKKQDTENVFSKKKKVVAGREPCSGELNGSLPQRR